MLFGGLVILQVLEHDENDARCQLEAKQGTSCIGTPGGAWQVVEVGDPVAWCYRHPLWAVLDSTTGRLDGAKAKTFAKFMGSFQLTIPSTGELS